jgi:hypothetical protein
MICVSTTLFAAGPDDDDFFESRIRPVLIEKCYKCHGSEKASSEFRVDSRNALLEGGEVGVAIVSGECDRRFSKVDSERSCLAEVGRRRSGRGIWSEAALGVYARRHAAAAGRQ